MCTPPLVTYSSVQDYRDHYERVYCQMPLVTFDNIPGKESKCCLRKLCGNYPT